MVKRFVAYILFGLAAMDTVALPLTILGFRPLYELPGVPPNFIRMAFMFVIISVLVIDLILICVGIIILIKSKKKIES